MTYFGGETPQPFDGVALLNAVLPPAGAMPPGAIQPAATFAGAMPAGLRPGMPPGGQPSTEVLRQQAAAVIQRCYRWLEAVAPTVPQVSALVPAMITAVQQYEAQQYAVSLNQAVAVAETIRQLQAAVPGLPAL